MIGSMSTQDSYDCKLNISDRADHHRERIEKLNKLIEVAPVEGALLLTDAKEFKEKQEETLDEETKQLIKETGELHNPRSCYISLEFHQRLCWRSKFLL
jgi:hypothetical protein